MYSGIYCEVNKKIKLTATDLIFARNVYNPHELLQLFIEGKKMCYYTSMCFPTRIVSVREQLTQEQNRNYFMHTIAEMIKKYGAEFIE